MECFLLRYGRVVSVRILVEKHCAFVNFERPQAAADALNGLQVCTIEFHLTAVQP